MTGPRGQPRGMRKLLVGCAQSSSFEVSEMFSDPSLVHACLLPLQVSLLIDSLNSATSSGSLGDLPQ